MWVPVWMHFCKEMCCLVQIIHFSKHIITSNYQNYIDVQVNTRVYNLHNDVIKWKHFPRYWPFVRGIHRSPVNFPHKRQWHGALMFSLIFACINGWVNNRKAGDLRRYSAHYDVIVMVELMASYVSSSLGELQCGVSSLYCNEYHGTDFCFYGLNFSYHCKLNIINGYVAQFYSLQLYYRRWCTYSAFRAR